MRSVLVFDAIFNQQPRARGLEDVADQIVEEHAAATAPHCRNASTARRRCVRRSATARRRPCRCARRSRNVSTCSRLHVMETARTAYSSIAAKQSFAVLAPEAVPDGSGDRIAHGEHRASPRQRTHIRLQFELQDDDATRRLVGEAATPGTPDRSAWRCDRDGGRRPQSRSARCTLLADAAHTDDANALLRQWRSVPRQDPVLSYHVFPIGGCARRTRRLKARTRSKLPTTTTWPFPDPSSLCRDHSSFRCCSAPSPQRHVWRWNSAPSHRLD